MNKNKLLLQILTAGGNHRGANLVRKSIARREHPHIQRLINQAANAKINEIRQVLQTANRKQKNLLSRLQYERKVAENKQREMHNLGLFMHFINANPMKKR